MKFKIGDKVVGTWVSSFNGKDYGLTKIVGVIDLVDANDPGSAYLVRDDEGNTKWVLTDLTEAAAE